MSGLEWYRLDDDDGSFVVAAGLDNKGCVKGTRDQKNHELEHDLGYYTLT